MKRTIQERIFDLDKFVVKLQDMIEFENGFFKMKDKSVSNNLRMNYHACKILANVHRLDQIKVKDIINYTES